MQPDCSAHSYSFLVRKLNIVAVKMKMEMEMEMEMCYIQRSWDNFPGTNFFSGKIESSNEGRVHRILKQVAELRLRSVVFFGDFSSSEIGQLGEKAGGGQMLQKWLLGSIWCVFICSPLKICK